MVVAEAHKKWQEAKENQQPSVVQQLKSKYETIKKKRTAKKKYMAQENAARKLQAACGGKAPATLDDVVKVADYIQRNIVVLNLDYQNSRPRNVEYDTRSNHDYGWEKTLFVYREVRSLPRS